MPLQWKLALEKVGSLCNILLGSQIVNECFDHAYADEESGIL